MCSSDCVQPEMNVHSVCFSFLQNGTGHFPNESPYIHFVEVGKVGFVLILGG